jgi:hypothetical protein
MKQRTIFSVFVLSFAMVSVAAFMEGFDVLQIATPLLFYLVLFLFSWSRYRLPQLFCYKSTLLVLLTNAIAYTSIRGFVGGDYWFVYLLTSPVWLVLIYYPQPGRPQALSEDTWNKEYDGDQKLGPMAKNGVSSKLPELPVQTATAITPGKQLSAMRTKHQLSRRQIADICAKDVPYVGVYPVDEKLIEMVESELVDRKTSLYVLRLASAGIITLNNK